MTPLRDWSFFRVLFVGVGWVVLCALAVSLWIYFQMASQMSGSAGIGAVSVGVTDIALWIPMGPPAALFLAWLIIRLRR